MLTKRPLHHIAVRAAIVLFATWHLNGCESLPEIPDDAIPIGVMLPFTGKDAAIGTNYEHALLMVADEINDSGGIGGRPVAFIVRDTHSNVTGAMAALRELKSEGVVAIIGPEDTEIAREVLPELQAVGLPLISPVISGGASVELQSGYKWFRLAPSASTMGRSFANRLWNDGVRQLGIVYSAGDYHQDFIGAFSERYSFLGGQVSPRVYLDDNVLSYTDAVSELNRSTTQNIVLSASVESAARFVNDLTSANRDDTWQYFLSPILETPVLPQNTVPGAIEGAMGIGIKASGFDDAFLSRYQKAWATDPLDGAYFYYDAAAVLCLALAQMYQQQGAHTSAALLEAIDKIAYRQGIQVKWYQLSQGLENIRLGKEISYSGLSGPLLFNSDGQQEKASIKFWTITNGAVSDDAP